MTQEDKELLLRDLCARLPYMSNVYTNNCLSPDDRGSYRLLGINANKRIVLLGLGVEHLDNIKPYLRPMSSMTNEEIETYRIITKSILANSITDNVPTLYNFLNSKHLDYNDLILKGLALPAPEGMYN